MADARMSWWLRTVFRLPRHLYDHGLGWLLGHRFLHLSHVGRRTGRRYGTVLEVVRYDPAVPEVVVVSGFGARSDWLRNLRAGAPATVILGRTIFHADHRMLDTEEKIATLADFERRNHLVGPVLRRVLSWLAGWPYRGTAEDRARLAGQLVLIGLRPAETAERPAVRDRTEGPLA